MSLKLLKEPYPLYQDARKQLPFILGLGIFIFLFLLVFQPFGISSMQAETRNYYLLGYGVITSISLVISQIFFPNFFRHFFDEEKWTVGKQFLYLLLIVSIILSVCYFYFNWYNDINFTTFGFWLFYSRSFALALFPVTAIILFDYISKLKIYQQPFPPLEQIPEPERKPSNAILLLKDENGKESIQVNVANVYFLKAANNYVEVNYLEADTPRKVLLRNSISEVEKQIQAPNLIRCHRSYIVNTSLVVNISGNAQGFKLHLKNSDWVVPVSRSKGKAFIKDFRNRL